MADAPERIWTQPDKKGYCITGVWPCRPSEQRNMIEYIRADQHLALVAAAYEECAQEMDEWRVTRDTPLSNVLRKGTPADAQAALEAVKRDARNEALREAANTARRCKDMPPEDAILALMEDTDDE